MRRGPPLPEGACYRRFGFRPSTAYGIEPPDPAWHPHFFVRPLAAHDPSQHGTFAYPPPFNDL